MTERIVAAAVVQGRVTVSMPAPARHSDIINYLARVGVTRKVRQHEQGFLTSTGRFVHRIEAKQIAVAAEQLLQRASHHDQLFSEDVW